MLRVGSNGGRAVRSRGPGGDKGPGPAPCDLKPGRSEGAPHGQARSGRLDTARGGCREGAHPPLHQRPQ